MMPSGPAGWVYVLTNPTLPGLCKIGMTGRAAAIRAREVSRSYGTALPFTVVSRHMTPDAAAIEWLAHRRLRRCRVPASELFRCDPDTAATVIKRAVLAYRPPSRLGRWLRRFLAPEPRVPGRSAFWRRYRRGTNWLPLLLAASVAAGAVAIMKPAPASWWPAPITRTVLFLERL